MGDEPDPLDIPASLKRDANNKAEFMMTSDVDVAEREPRPAKKAKASNGHDKAASKPAVKMAPKVPAKVKTAPKAATKAAKAPQKAKATAKAKAPAEKDAFGLRKGSAKSKAAAMYARKNGATLEEVKEALGSVQLNVLNSLEEAGHEVERRKEDRKGARSVTRYVLKLKA